MSSLDFFAVLEDQISLLEFIFQQTDLRVFELASQPDQHLRRFASVGELQEAFSLGIDVCGNGHTVSLSLTSPSVERGVEVRRTTLDTHRCKGATFREALHGGALLQLYLGGVHGELITKSHFGHNSKERATKWGLADGIDWPALSRLSRRIQHQLRSRLATDRVPGRPILPRAAELWRKGYVLKECAKSPHHWTSEGLQPDASPSLQQISPGH